MVLRLKAQDKPTVLEHVRRAITVLKQRSSLMVTDFSPENGGYGLYAIPLDGGPRRCLTSPKPLAHDVYPRPSHDGRLLAFARCYSRSPCKLFVMDKQGSLRPVVSQLSDIYGISWLPGDRRLIYAASRAGASQLWSVDLSGADPVLVPTQSAQSSDPAIAPDGSWVAYTVSHRNWNIWRACLVCGAKKQQLFISSSGRNRAPRYSPDGRQIAFVSDRSSAWEIFTCDADGQNLRKLTHFGGPFVGGPAWSPDGRVIAFDARVNGHSGIYFIDGNGGSPRVMEQNEFEDRMPSWSGDGKWIYFNSNRSGLATIWKKRLPDGKPVQVSRTTAFKAAESGDGPGI